MKMEILLLIFGAGMLACLAAAVVCIVYFLHEWKKLDRILEEFRSGRLDSGDDQEMEDYGSGNEDIRETRESRLVSELRQILNNAYFKQNQALEEKNQVMELISDLSHQLKTPLANMVMDTELLQNESLTREQQTGFLRHIRGQADKMQWLMENLLKASRLENGMIEFPVKNEGIKETLAKAVSSVYAQAAKKQIEIQVEEFEDFTLYHNPKWTAEALANIFENAVKYSPEKSCVKVGISRLDIYTRITITDQGIGMAETEYNRIFQRFYRGNQVEQEEGSGLGLYLAQLILLQEKGYITVSSKIGRGSCFSVFLLNQG